MKEKNKGITLIALIITIIIMLILVAVSISLALNSGLFEKAGSVSKETEIAKEQETELSSGRVNIGGKEYASIDDYLAGQEIIKEIHNWQYTDDTRATIKCECEECKKINVEGVTYNIGQEVAYGVKENVDSTEIAQLALSSNTEDAKITTLEQKENDVEIKLMAVQIPETRWIIFGVEDKNKNGTNESLLITTLEPSNTRLYLEGADAYINGIQKMEETVKELYGEEARAMTIEDVNNCLGYTPAGGIYAGESTIKTTKNFTTKLSELEIWSNIQNYNETNEKGKYYTPEYPEGTTDASKLENYELNGYFYQLSSDKTYLVDPTDATNTTHTVTTTMRNLIFGNSNNYYYWLASRGVCADWHCAVFGPGSVSGGGANSYGFYFGSGGDSKSHDLSLRAVVALRSEIPAVGEILISND